MGGKKKKESEDKELAEAKAKLARDFEADKAYLKQVQDDVRARGGIQLTAAQAETAERMVKRGEERLKAIDARLNERKAAAGMQ